MSDEQRCQNRYDIFKFFGVALFLVSLMNALKYAYKQQFASNQLRLAFIGVLALRPLLLTAYSTIITFCTGLPSQGGKEQENDEPSTEDERCEQFLHLPIVMWFGLARVVQVADRSS